MRWTEALVQDIFLGFAATEFSQPDSLFNLICATLHLQGTESYWAASLSLLFAFFVFEHVTFILISGSSGLQARLNSPPLIAASCFVVRAELILAQQIMVQCSRLLQINMERRQDPPL